ncbi:MAG: bifunctional helix-turn-helix transcriptional regulator/GNAT family N-acetyltransferase [Acidimicrobiales bacterium]
MEMTTETRVAAVRAFNRFYTNVIGVLRSGLLDSPYSLTEVQVMFELAQRDAIDLADVRLTVDIDAGYLSRILARFEADGLVVRERSSVDGRRQVIGLTDRGRDVFAGLDDRSADEVRTLLARVTDEDQRRMVGAMATIQELLGDGTRSASFVVRPPEPGDFGWVVHRHGVLYSMEYGWDETYEALVAQIAADYAAGHDPKREAAWIAEVEGEPVGSVFCVKRDDGVAQLRLLLVEPRARGMGIGGRLVDECIRFARRAGYQRMMLWTTDVLASARRIYQRAGFELGEQEQQHRWGHDIVGQTWWLTL